MAPAPLTSPLSDTPDLLQNQPIASDGVTDATENSDLDPSDTTNDHIELNEDTAVLLQNITVNPSGTNVDLPSASEFQCPGWVRRSERASKPVKKYGT